MKKLFLLIFVIVAFPLVLLALTQLRGVALFNSTIDSTAIGAVIPSSGAFTTLSTTSPITFGGRLTENAGVVNTGTGFKHMRVGACTTPATTNGTCNFTPSWPSAFADANYTAVCISENSGAAVMGAGSHTTVSINIVIENSPGVITAVTPTVDCVGIHD